MPVTATRSITITYSGDVVGTEIINALSNATSVGAVELKTLAAGANTITIPIIGSNVPTAVTVVPPSSNTNSITLKGVGGDTGFRLHDKDPSTITLHSSVTTFVLTAGAEIVGVRLFWS
jgi:hypothetical protein